MDDFQLSANIFCCRGQERLAFSNASYWKRYPPKRLKAQTVLHNFYLKRDDATTAAERLFRHKFPDPLEWVVERMGDLPLPRRSNSLAMKPFDITGCPALWR